MALPRISLLAALTLLACGSFPVVAAAAADKPATAAERAESLSQEQISASHNKQALAQLAKFYVKLGDRQRYNWALERLLQLDPGNFDRAMALATSYAAVDDKSAAYDLLLRMKKQGFGADLADDPRFKKIHGTEVWDYIVKSLASNLKPFGDGKVAFELPAKDLLIQSLAWDPDREQLLAGSAREGKVFVVGKDGKLETLLAPDGKMPLWSVFDLAVDAEHNRLWVATTSVVHFKGYDEENAGKAALLGFDLASGKLEQKYVLDGRGKYLSTLALAPDGQVFAADGVHKVIYTVQDGKLAELTRNPRLSGISAMAVNGDGTVLYLADPDIGILGLELASAKPFGLRFNRASLVLPGITGMHWFDGTLVVVEPGMQPARVMRLTLTDDGRSVENAMPIDVARPEFQGLGGGAAAGNKLYFVTDLERDKYDGYGLRKDDAPLEPVPVFVSNMRFAWGQGGIKTGLSEIPKSSNPGLQPTGKK